MEYDDWEWEIGLDTFKDDLEVDGGVRDEGEDVGKGEADETVMPEPWDMPVVNDIPLDEPLILDVLVEDPADLSSP